MERTEKTGNGERCMECGKPIGSGRTDRKFCCGRCKNAYNNRRTKLSRNGYMRTISLLRKNYEILRTLIGAGFSTVDMGDALRLGYRPEIVTGYRKVGRRGEYSCFEISYFQTPTKICGLQRSELLLSEASAAYGNRGRRDGEASAGEPNPSDGKRHGH